MSTETPLPEEIFDLGPLLGQAFSALQQGQEQAALKLLSDLTPAELSQTLATLAHLERACKVAEVNVKRRAKLAALRQNRPL